jgi:hypothetical protein
MLEWATPHGDDSRRGLADTRSPERAQLPADVQDARADEGIACVHPTVLWWRGACLGCRTVPLPPRCLLRGSQAPSFHALNP